MDRAHAIILVAAVVLLGSAMAILSVFERTTRGDVPDVLDRSEEEMTVPTDAEGGMMPEELSYDPADLERFVVPLEYTADSLADALLAEEFVADREPIRSLLAGVAISPGAYRLAPGMRTETIVHVLSGDPYMVWVQIPEGLRKEEIAARLRSALGWSGAREQAWIDTYTTEEPDQVEGVYFPNTYLIPAGESPEEAAERLRAKFHEVFAPYLVQFNAQNIQWTTGLTLASIVQREAASDADMPLIAGILWNRLDENMHLNADATLQYARGNTGAGWWAPITTVEKDLDSPFNTYRYRGLPPHPIANPGISALEAVLNPTVTDCFYYLHDNEGQTHCSVTYEEHQEKIQQYLVGEG